jgi:cysteine-rich repeat protein
VVVQWPVKTYVFPAIPAVIPTFSGHPPISGHTILFDEGVGQDVNGAFGDGLLGYLGSSAAVENADPQWTSHVGWPYPGNSSLYFDGIDDVVTISGDAMSGNSSALAIEFSFWLDGYLGDPDKLMISKPGEYAIWVTSDGHVQFDVFDTGGGVHSFKTEEGSMNYPRGMVDVAFIWDGYTVALLHEGAISAFSAQVEIRNKLYLAQFTRMLTNSNLIIGGGFRGWIDELRISHEVLTYDQIRYDESLRNRPGCGNSVVESWEQCDDGNTADGDCCAANCRFETGSCNDGDACTTNDTCDGSGLCVGGPLMDCSPGGDHCVQGTCPCGGGPSCSAGQRCVNENCECDAISCPNGCCDGNSCMPLSLSTCGLAGGGTCTICDPALADACTNGTCTCGTGSACSMGQRCLSGSCGTGPTLTRNTFLGGGGDDTGYAIAVDGSGNVLVAGWSGGTWASPVQAYGTGSEAFVAKLNPDGALTWNTFLGGGQDDIISAIAVDSSGNVYVAGYGPRDFGIFDTFVAKLSPDGALTWNTVLGGGRDDFVGAIAVDGSGNVLVAGSSNETWGSPLLECGFGGDAFVAKVNSAGDLTWNTFLGGDGGQSGWAIAVNGSGDVFVAGDSDRPWGSPVRPHTAEDGQWQYDAFIAMLESDGALNWNTFLGSSADDYAYGIAVDDSNNVYVTGLSNSTWGSPVRPYTAGADTFAAKVDSAGVLTWNTFLGGSGADTGRGIAVDGSGDVYVGGDADGTWGIPVRAYTAEYDAFLARLDSDGGLRWNTFLGGSGGDTGRGIAVVGSGNVYMTGWSTDTWGSPVRPYTALADTFVVQIGDAPPTQTPTHTPTVTDTPTPTPECGNGIVEGTEECDDANTQDGDCCAASCQYETGSCDDGDACTTNDTCDSSGVCVGGGPVDCAPAGDQCVSGACSCGGGPTCSAGQRCVSGTCVCDATSCPSGCCSGNTCMVPSPLSCGTGGASCVACDPTHADTCTNGTCLCGSGPACGTGQRCASGACVCDATSCPTGCCSGNTCMAPSPTSCGTGGASCVACDPARADTCANGTCSCGSGPACGTGQRCASGACICDATSCPSSCCSGKTCITPSPTSCGTGGASCVTCDPTRADICTNGTCSCGVGPACAAGQACVNGTCVVLCGNGALDPGEQCDDGNTQDGDCCSATCQFETGSCDDGSTCTTNDTCKGGSCSGTPQPTTSCRPAAKSMLKLHDDTRDERDSIMFRWLNGSATAAEFADPVNTSGYALCVYDEAGLILRAEVPAGGMCDEKPCWSASTTGYKYRDRSNRSDGISQIMLGGYEADPKAKAMVKGRGINLIGPVLPGTGTVTAQLVNGESGFCVEGVYSGEQIVVNDGEELKARVP